MRRPLIVTCFVLAVLGGGALAAQETLPPAEATREEMQKLAFLLGRWQGSGWIERQLQRVEFHAVQTVDSRLDGLLVMVEGHHSPSTRGGADAALVHQALGVFSWDVTADRYHVSTYLANGYVGDAEAWLDDGKLIWQLSPSGIEIRYTFDVRDGRWLEVGEISSDGKSWRQFLALTLTRTE